MTITTVKFDLNTFGITQKSLRMLRNTLAERINHRIAVVEVPTNTICCGYFILDRDANEAVFTGDGFRTDGGGEGGEGYMAAEALFRVYRIRPIPWEVVNIDYTQDTGAIEKALLQIARKIATTLDEKLFVPPAKTMPTYLR